MNTIQKVILTIAFFILALLPFGWTRGQEILLGYDNVFPVNAKTFLYDRLFSWSDVQNFGMDQSGIQGSLVIHFIDALPQLLGMPVIWGQRLVLTLWFFLLLLSGYIFAVRLERHKYIGVPYVRYLFPVLYAVNFYTLQAWWIAERTKFSLVVATPLILSLILPWFTSSLSIRRIVWSALIAAGILTLFNGGGWMGLSLYGGLLLVLGIFYIVMVSIKLITRSYRDVLLVHVWFILFMFIFFLFNAYTFFPFIARTVKGYQTFLASAGGVSGVLGWTLYLSENTSFTNLFRLQGIPDWYNNGSFHPYANNFLENPVLIIASFLFPFSVLVALKRYGKEYTILTVYFLLLLLVSLFFTAGSHPPLGFLFEILMQKIPGFVLFRSPIYKFGYAFWFAMSFFVALGVSACIDSIAKFIRDRSSVVVSTSISVGVTVLVISAILAYHFPFVTGDFFRMSAASFASRVEIPQHVGDFSQWWVKEGKGKRVLLLPKLNENWLFEQYRWKYLSLYPILGNFGNTGIVENLDNLTPQESHLLNLLYRSIEKRQYDVMNMVSRLLGIQYILVRRDFYYDFPDQEAVRPDTLDAILKDSGQVSLARVFGPWDLWQYTEDRSPIRAVSLTDIAYADVSRAASVGDVLPGSLFLGDEAYELAAHASVNPAYVYAMCWSCVAERERVSVQFPATRVLPDSPLYPFVEWKNWFLRSKKTGEPYLYSLLGEQLKMTAELGALTNRGQSVFIEQVARRYEKTINELDTKFDAALSESLNPYVFSSAVNEYTSAQLNLLSSYLFLTKKEDLQDIQNIIGKLTSLKEKATSVYSSRDFGRKNFFGPVVASPGVYSVTLRNSTDSVQVFVDGAVVKGPVYLQEGKHIFEAIYGEPKNLAENFHPEAIAGSQCFSSVVPGYDKEFSYRLRFDTLKNLGKRFFFFIDAGEAFAPMASFPIGDVTNESGGFDAVFSPGTFGSVISLKQLRLAFCAPLLTGELFDETVKNFSFVKLVDPVIRLEKEKAALVASSHPELIARQNNPTSYSVKVQNAHEPFYLVLYSRFDRGWKVHILDSKEEIHEDFHMVANTIHNAWYIEKTGSFELEIQYAPQQFFYKGALISSVSILLGFTAFVLLHRGKKFV